MGVFTNNCERYGSKLNDNNWRKTDFKCPKCEDIKFERKALEPVLKKVRKNFIEIKKLDIGCFAENLYVYGGYVEQKTLCCDIDFLIIFNELKLEDYIEKKLKLFVDKLWNYYDDEAESVEFMTLKMIGLLEKGDFWDFRSCEEYPDCLSCFEDEGGDCLCFEEGFYSELRKTGFHNICLLECNNDKKQIIPDCMFSHKCPYHFFKGAVKDYFTHKIYVMLKDQADISFESSDMNVKVLHLKGDYSIQGFQKKNQKLEFRFIKIE